jgi:hypothetical protein
MTNPRKKKRKMKSKLRIIRKLLESLTLRKRSKIPKFKILSSIESVDFILAKRTQERCKTIIS